MIPSLDVARRRATALLAATTYFDTLGLGDLAADSRAVARLLLELADELDAERSARVAIQAARDNAVAILGRRAGDACARGGTP